MVCRKGWGKASFHCLAVLIFHNLFSLLLPCRRTSENPQARHCESWFLSPLQAIYWIHINRFPLNFGWLTLSIKVHKYKCFKKFFFLGVPEKKKNNTEISKAIHPGATWTNYFQCQPQLLPVSLSDHLSRSFSPPPPQLLLLFSTP